MTNSTFEEPKHPETGDPYFLSTKTIPPEERLIFALDVPSVEEAKRLVERLDDAVQFYKVGLELLGTGGYFELIEWLAGREKKVFADLKLFDVPETVRSAVRRLRDWPITLTTVHAGSAAILEAACREKGDLKILAVTVLTSLSQEDLRAMASRGMSTRWCSGAPPRRSTSAATAWSPPGSKRTPCASAWERSP